MHVPTLIHAVDVESNGGSPPEIIELSIVTILDDETCEEPITWLIRPVRPVTAIASRIHGIADIDLIHSKNIDFLRGEITSVLRDDPIVAHNAHVDYNLLSRALPNWKPRSVHDTLRLARRTCPGLESYGLANLLRHFSLTEGIQGCCATGPHRACYDAIGAARLFLSLMKHAASAGIGTANAMTMSTLHADDPNAAIQGLLF